MLSAINFLKRFSAELRKREQPPALSPLKGTTVKALIYPSASARSTILMVPGIHPSGIFDLRLHAFAKAVCSAGFQVIAPDIEDFRNLKVTTGSIDQLEELVASLHLNFPDSTLRNTGMLGISYGAGPVFVAASRKGVRDAINFLVAIGGYADFRRSLEFATLGTVQGQKPARRSQDYGRAIFALNHIEHFLPSQSHEKMRRILQQLLPPANEHASSLTDELSSTEEQFLKEIRDGFATHITTVHSILERNTAFWEQFSPGSHIDELSRDVRVYLLHGRNDDLVPFEESEELDRLLGADGIRRVRTLITSSLSHVDIQHTKDLWAYVRLLFWLQAVLSESK